jgi:ParB family chromosome partitioning protein
MTTETMRMRSLEGLFPNPLNPRGSIDTYDVDELAASIRAQGVLQPLLVTPDGTIVAGHRRYLAALRAGIGQVPVLERALSEDQQLEVMLVENLQREALTPLQEARAYRRMIDAGANVADLARRLGVARDRIARRLEVLQLAPEVQDQLDRYEIPITLARPLSRIQDWPTQRRLAVFAARRGLKVAVLERLVDRSLGGDAPFARTPRPVVAAAPTNVRAVRADLLAALEADPERRLTFGRLAQAVGDVCCACGMQDQPEICGACPLPTLLVELVG